MTVSLSTEFLNQFPNFPKQMNTLGRFVYLRTYSRYGEGGKHRREYYKESVKRAVEYNVNLEAKHFEKLGLPYDKQELEKELKLMFSNVFNLRQFPSGRTLFVGGAETGVANKYPLANYNCAFNNIESWKNMGDLFYLLLVGVGVGFKSFLKMARNLPPLRTDIKIIHAPYEPVEKEARLEHTKVVDLENGFAKIYIGDSKEGWVEAVRAFFDILAGTNYDHIHTIKFSYNSVRPAGEELKTFGGHASGPDPLREMFEGFDKVIKNQIDPYLTPLEPATVKNGKVHRFYIRPVHLLDMCNLIGNNVVVGGVRRTAEIFLIDENDWESIWAKYGVTGFWKEEHFKKHEKVLAWLEKNRWWLKSKGTDIPQFMYDLCQRNYDPEFNKNYTTGQPNREEDGSLSPYNVCRYQGHRAMSNNSVAFTKKPEKKFIEFLRIVMEMNGEPGFVNLREAAIRRLKAQGIFNPSEELIAFTIDQIGLNPCAEIILWKNGVCNLTTINVMSFVFKQGDEYFLDLTSILQAQRLSARIGLRMTLVDLELDEWSQTQSRDRLVGTSMTGWQDAIDLLGFDKNKEKLLLNTLRKTAQDEAKRYAKKLRVAVPLLVTTVKPEGTLTQVAGGPSSGVHRSEAPYFIRRIRISAMDPLAKAALKHKGWVINPENGTPGASYEEKMANARTLVIDFPNFSGAKKTKENQTLEGQFEDYFMFQEEYTDHNTSNTIIVQPDEWDKMVDIVYENWDRFVAVSFLSYDKGTYELPPFEAITKQRYEELVEQMEPFNMDYLYEYDNKDGSSLDGADNCESGVCPIR